MLKKILEYEMQWVKVLTKFGVSIGYAVNNPDNVNLKFAVMKEFDLEKWEVTGLWDSFDFLKDK